MSLLKIRRLVSVLIADASSLKDLNTISNDIQVTQSHDDLRLSLQSYDSVQQITYDILLGYIHDDTDKLKTLFSAVDTGHLAIAGLLAVINRGAKPESYLSELALLVAAQNTEYDQALRRIGHVLGWGSVSKALKHIYTGNTLWDASIIATYLTMRYTDSLGEAHNLVVLQSPEIACVIRAIRTISDDDSVIMTDNEDTNELARKLQAMKAKI